MKREILEALVILNRLSLSDGEEMDGFDKGYDETIKSCIKDIKEAVWKDSEEDWDFDGPGAMSLQAIVDAGHVIQTILNFSPSRGLYQSLIYGATKKQRDEIKIST